MDFSKLYCQKHPNDIIINFCNKQQCQLQLCASCLGQHTQYHLIKRTNPSYQNIRTTYKILINSLKDQAQQFQCLNNRLVKVQCKSEQKRQKIKQIIKIAEQQSIQFIRNFYENKQKQMLLQIDYMDKKYGLHCALRFDNIKKIIATQISNLQTISKQINYHNFIEYIPKLKMQVIHNSKITAKQINQQIIQNQLYNTSISYNKNLLNQLKENLNKIINLSICINKQNKLTNFPIASFDNKFIGKQTNSQYQTQTIIQKQPKLFTLRRPDSQGSQSTIGYNYQVKDKKQENFKNVFQNQSVQQKQTNKQSRFTLTSKKKMKNQQNYSQFVQNKSNCKKQNNSALGQIPFESHKNYDFTFGSQVQPYYGLDKLKQDYSIGSSRISEKVYIPRSNKQEELIVSDFQAQNLKKTNINKMQKKDRKFHASELYQGFLKQNSKNLHKPNKQSVFRSQFQ